MEEGHIGHGVIIERGDGGDPETWTKIGKILEPDFPNPSRETAQVSHTESPDKYHERISGFRDGGEVAPTILLDMGSEAYQALLDDFNSDEPVHYRCVSPSGEEAWEFRAYLTSLEHETPLEDTNTVVPTFQITGKPALEDLS